MSRPNGWIVGLLALAFVPVLVVTPEARTPENGTDFALVPSPSVPLLLGGCPSIAAREAVEEEDCLQAARFDLIAGQITVGQALERLEWCTGQRPDLASLAARSDAIRLDRIRAQLAFGDPAGWPTDGLEQGARERLVAEAAAIPSVRVGRLRAAGITPAGLASGDGAAVLDRLGRDASLRSDFRAVFGDHLADDLEALLAGGAEGYPAALSIGGSMVVPNIPEPGTAAGATEGDDAPGAEPLVVARGVYLDRVVAELRGLEASRLRFLSSAAREHHEVGSVNAFLTSAKSLGRRDGVSAEAREQTERDRAAMMARLRRLERRLGLDPLLYQAALESVGNSAAIDESCGVASLSRQRWVRRGAGALTGLVGAAGFVVATGATGTMIGGVTIAAALEATVGAYLIARTEGPPSRHEEPGRLASLLPGEMEEREFRRPDLDLVLEEGDAGSGDGEYDEWFADEGLPWEWEGMEAEGVEEESEDLTEQGPRENSIAAILPVPAPEELRELPPLMDRAEIRELAELSLPEIQESLERFLAVTNPEVWTQLAEEEEELAPSSLEAMIEEARSALRLWEREKILSAGFGPFFIQAELEQIAPRQRPEILSRAMSRYTYDRDIYVESRDVEELRRRMAVRLVANCRAQRSAGDLVLSACSDETALSILIIAALRDAGVSPPPGAVLGVQVFGRRFEAVLYDSFADRVYSLTKGTVIDGVVAPIFHPATFYYTYLVAHNVVPDIDSDEHLLIALPNRAMPEGMDDTECRDPRSVVTRAVEWIVSWVGIRRISHNPCDPAEGSQPGGGDGGSDEPRVSIAMPMPQNPFQRGGGSSGGGQGGGSGGGGGQSISPAGPRDAGSEGGSSAGSEPSGASSGGGEQGGGQAGQDAGKGASPSGAGAAASPNDPVNPRFAGDPTGSSGESGERTGTNSSTTSSSGSGGSGGYSAGNVSVPGSPNLTEVGNTASAMISRFQRSLNEGVAPWRLREDEGMMTGSTTRVLYADNQRALDRFAEDDLFITLTPAEVEAQRRMLEADVFMVYPAQTDCDAVGLPPRRVFRRTSAEPPGFRYVFCDHDESKVVFRDQDDAERYANFIPPDRPLYLASLATERLDSFDRSVEVARLRAFLQDPNVVRQHSKDDLYAMVRTAADLLVFQNALESALVQSMNELGESNLKTYYFDMHRQVLQAPLFIEMAQSVYRLNQRLASDPLQSLAWANAQPSLAKRGFFDLYHTLGGMMEWPERWATLEERYTSYSGTAPTRGENAPSLDFLQILSDPTRVRIDWHEERVSRASISDVQMLDGLVRTSQLKETPTASERTDRQDEDEHFRGGTSGLGRAGEGESIGPERGSRPLQMLYVRIAPEDGEPDRRRVPEDNQVKPGGTEGEKRTQTMESATRQEPILWVTPSTFVEAILSTWDNDYPAPGEAARIPPILRFNEPLRELYLRDFRDVGVYENRLRTAMQVFTKGDWLAYREPREAMGGSMVSVRARDTGRFSAAYSGNAPINDQDQIRVPNFFTRSGVIIPEDLFPPVREHYREAILGIFDLAEAGEVRAAAPISSLPLNDDEDAAAGRNRVLRSLELISEEAAEAP